MSHPISPAVQKLIDAYARDLPDRCRQLREMAPADGNTEQLQNYEKEVHKIAGSSGSYGFRELSEALRRLDRYLGDCSAGEIAYDYAEDRRMWEAAMRTLPAG